jgi:hypothetical protein
MDDSSNETTSVVLKITLQPSSTDPLSESVKLSLERAIQNGVNNLREFAKTQEAPGNCVWTKYRRKEPWNDVEYEFDKFYKFGIQTRICVLNNQDIQNMKGYIDQENKNSIIQSVLGKINAWIEAFVDGCRNSSETILIDSPNLAPSYVDLIFKSPKFRDEKKNDYYHWNLTTRLYLQVIDEYNNAIKAMSKYEFFNPVTDNRDEFEFKKALTSWNGRANNDDEEDL